MRITSAAFGITASLTLVSAGAVCQDFPKPDATFEESKRFYDASLGVESFQWRARALDSLAQTHDKRGMEILKKRYIDARPGGKSSEGQGNESSWQLRYLLAGTFGHYMHAGGGADLRQWVSGFKEDSDAWLWFQVLRAYVNQEGSAATVKLVKDRGVNKFVRAAAVEVLAKNGADDVLPLIAELLELKNLPKPGLELRLLATCTAGALRAPNLKAKRETPEYRAAALAVISLLDIKDIDDATKLIVARQLAALFGVDARERQGAPWIRRLDKVPEPPRSDSDTGVVPSFMGIPGRGQRFVYVIDLSDSMLIPLTQDDKDEFDRGGHDTSVGAADLTKEPTIKLPWTSIRHRLDAARECFRMALRDLTEDKLFAVVVFGDVAETFKCTPGLVKATRANIAAAERELDSFDPMGTSVGDKKGLKGKTNMHGGLRLAFRLTEKGPIPGDDEYVNPLTFTNGADTVFVLTDGVPNWDDFPGKGALEPDTHSGDRETGRKDPSKGINVQYEYPGPYSDKTFYLRDVQRMNLFRQVEIHCVGMGEAHTGWLDATAKLGLGKSRRVGKDSR